MKYLTLQIMEDSWFMVILAFPKQYHVSSTPIYPI